MQECLLASRQGSSAITTSIKVKECYVEAVRRSQKYFLGPVGLLETFLAVMVQEWHACSWCSVDDRGLHHILHVPHAACRAHLHNMPHHSCKHPVPVLRVFTVTTCCGPGIY